MRLKGYHPTKVIHCMIKYMIYVLTLYDVDMGNGRCLFRKRLIVLVLIEWRIKLHMAPQQKE
jgi:hypothetical protein